MMWVTADLRSIIEVCWIQKSTILSSCGLSITTFPFKGMDPTEMIILSSFYLLSCRSKPMTLM